jgi:hypothetical protein
MFMDRLNTRNILRRKKQKLQGDNYGPVWIPLVFANFYESGFQKLGGIQTDQFLLPVFARYLKTRKLLISSFRQFLVTHRAINEVRFLKTRGSKHSHQFLLRIQILETRGKH